MPRSVALAASAVVAASPDTLFAFYEDPVSAPVYSLAIKEIDVVERSRNATGGWSFRADIRTNNGRKATLAVEDLLFRPPHRMVTRSRTPGATIVSSTLLDPAEGGTRVWSTGEFAYHKRAIFSQMRLLMEQRGLAIGLARVQARFEDRPLPSPPLPIFVDSRVALAVFGGGLAGSIVTVPVGFVAGLAAGAGLWVQRAVVIALILAGIEVGCYLMRLATAEFAPGWEPVATTYPEATATGGK